MSKNTIAELLELISTGACSGFGCGDEGERLCYPCAAKALLPEAKELELLKRWLQACDKEGLIAARGVYEAVKSKPRGECAGYGIVEGNASVLNEVYCLVLEIKKKLILAETDQ